MKKSLYEFCIENNKSGLLLEWDDTANGEMTPKMVAYGSGKKVWWRCEKGHTWQAVINSRSNGSGCPVCAGKVVLNGYNDLATELPELAQQWHPSQNAPLTPSQVTRGSHRLVWWRCKKGHEWQANVSSRTLEQTGCPYCANRKVLAGFNDLATQEPKIAQQWHPTLNGSLMPEQVTAGSKRKVWWICSEGHVWKAVVFSRTGSRKTGCPVCAGNVSQKKRRWYNMLEQNGKLKK